MLDINLFRKDKGGDPELVKASIKKRFKSEELVDKVIELDNQWKKRINLNFDFIKLLNKVKFELDTTNKDVNKICQEIGKIKKGNKEATCEKELAIKQELEKKQEFLKQEEIVLKQQLDSAVKKIGNLVDSSVPVSKDEADNQIVKEFEKEKQRKFDPKTMKHHHELFYMIDGYDMKRGTKLSGHRGYFLRGPGVLLNLALQQFSINFLTKRGYLPMSTPFFMKKDIMAKTSQLSDFDETLYKVSEGTNNPDGSGEYYLIATSEQPISSYYQGEWLEPKDMPYRYAGLSTCFRKEAGASGKDMWGIFRVHQFEKIEQFCITSPVNIHYFIVLKEKSWEMHDEMLKTAEEFYQALQLPYRVVNIVSGELNDAAAKKYDLEAWFPGYDNYRELVSCSNCTDYQSRGLEIRYGAKTKGVSFKTNQQLFELKAENKKTYVHMLNATLCATERTMCCILENYQTPKGIEVPEVLRPFMGMDFIPFVKESPKQKDLE